jgi:hypothetical protein
VTPEPSSLTHVLTSMGGNGAGSLLVNFPKIGGSVSTRIQGEGGKQVLAPTVLQQTGYLASRLLFGPKGLVLRPSMALIPIVMIPIFPRRENPQIQIII